MSKKSTRDYSPLYTVLGALLIVAIGFGTAWFYQRHMAKLRRQIAYSQPVQVVVGNNGYSIRASFSTRTNGADTGWATDHQRALEAVVKKNLLEADPNKLLAPSGLKAFQESLKDKSNAALNTDKIQEVLITDFLLSSHDN